MSTPQEQLPTQPPPLPDLSDLSAKRWTIEQAPAVKDWFKLRYGRELPVTAFGESKTHARMGLDHRESFDVALSPSSDEGRELINFLKSANIPHRAITAADVAAGVKATGEHIHVGEPSHGLGTPVAGLPDLSDLADGAQASTLPDLADLHDDPNDTTAPGWGDPYRYSPLTKDEFDNSEHVDAAIDGRTGRPLAKDDPRRLYPASDATLFKQGDPLANSGAGVRTAVDVAKWANNAPDLPHGFDVGEPLKVRVPAGLDDAQTYAALSDATLAALGPAAKRAGAEYRRATGHNLAQPNVSFAGLVKQGLAVAVKDASGNVVGFDVTIAPKRHLIDTVNAINAEGVEGALRVADELVQQAHDYNKVYDERPQPGLGKQVIGDTVTSGAQLAHNVTELARGSFVRGSGVNLPGAGFDEWARQNARDQELLDAARASLPRSQTNTQQALRTVGDLAAKLPQYALAGEGAPLMMMLEAAHEGPERMFVEGMKGAVTQGAGRAAKGLLIGTEDAAGVLSAHPVLANVAARGAQGATFAAQGATEPEGRTVRGALTNFGAGAILPVGAPERGPAESVHNDPLGLFTEARPVEPAPSGQVVTKDTPLPLQVDLRAPDGETYTLNTESGMMTRHSTGEQMHVDELAARQSPTETLTTAGYQVKRTPAPNARPGAVRADVWQVTAPDGRRQVFTSDSELQDFAATVGRSTPTSSTTTPAEQPPVSARQVALPKDPMTVREAHRLALVEFARQHGHSEPEAQEFAAQRVREVEQQGKPFMRHADGSPFDDKDLHRYVQSSDAPIISVRDPETLAALEGFRQERQAQHLPDLSDLSDLHQAPPTGEWQQFPEHMQSLNVPRASMPQIKSEHRGAMVQFLKGRGITHMQEQVAPDTLKPSQVEFSPAKVNKARGFDGPARSILVSADNYVVDGHHQWLADLTDAPDKPIPVIRLNAPIQQLLIEGARFPSSGVDDAGGKVGSTARRAADMTGGDVLDEAAANYTPRPDYEPVPPTARQRVPRAAIDLLNLPKATLTSLSAHGAARQGLVPSVTHPVLALKALGQQFASMFSKSSYEDFTAALANHPETNLARKAGLYLSTLAGRGFNAREEFFASGLADKLPGVKQSSRAYSAYLDSLRFNLWQRYAAELRGAGFTPETNPAHFEATAKLINSLTGRGELPAALERAAPVLNAAFFSPRMMKSRIDLLNPKFFLDMPPAARRIAAREMIKFAGTMATTLALAKLTGAADVSLDPRDADFLKARIGRTHYDVLGGFRGPIKLTAELMKTFADEAQGHKIPRGHDPVSVAARYFRGNLAPVVGAGVDAVAGTDIAGRPFQVSRAAWQRLAPIFVQALREGWRTAGGRGAAQALPSGLGVGVETYEPKAQH